MSDSSKGSKGKQGKFLSKSKTLLDIIVDEESGSAYKNLVDRSGQTKHRKSSLRDRLRLRRSASTSSTTKPSSSPEVSDIPMPQPVPASDVPLQTNSRKFDRTQSSCGPSRSLSRIQSTCGSARSLSRLRSTVHHEAKDEEDDDDDDEEEEEEKEEEEEEAEKAVVIPPEEDVGEERNGGGSGQVEGRRENLNLNPIVREEQPPPITMSLMDLLEETDRQAGIVGKKYLDEEGEEEEVEEEEIEEEDGEDGGGGQYVCCVCMVRHKGAAFIPCGHTFCRLCSRELWVSRGNCPLCNGYILEILDIF